MHAVQLILIGAVEDGFDLKERVRNVRVTRWGAGGTVGQHRRDFLRSDHLPRRESAGVPA